MDEEYWREEIKRLKNENRELHHALGRMQSQLETTFIIVNESYDRVKDITGFEFSKVIKRVD